MLPRAVCAVAAGCLLLIGLPIFVVLVPWTDEHWVRKVVVRGLASGIALLMAAYVVGLVHDPWPSGRVQQSTPAVNSTTTAPETTQRDFSAQKLAPSDNQPAKALSLDAVISSLLSIIGIILTIMTGYAMAASWRATDEARRAADLASSRVREQRRPFKPK